MMRKLLSARRKWVIISFLSSSLLPLFYVLVISTVIFAVIGAISGEDDEEDGGDMVCNPDGELDKKKWAEYFESQEESGDLEGHGDDIIDLAEDEGIDPVLFGAIALHESAYGESDAIQDKNNPGGIMESDGNTLKTFPSLKDGLEAMSVTLHNRIIEDGLVDIEDLGDVYAPPDADNDPDGLNEHWVPTVEALSEDLGGLTMNCEDVGDIDIDGEKAWIAPHTKQISSGFGRREACAECSSFHEGIDIATDGIKDTPAVAFMDGEVTLSKAQDDDNLSEGYGYYVEVDHGDGIKTRYAHLNEEGIDEGEEVEKGDKVGDIGSTGTSTAPHLHFEVLEDDEAVDPMPHVKDLLKDDD